MRLLAALPLLALSVAPALAAEDCPMPAEPTLQDLALPAARAAKEHHGPIKIVALGSGPTEGTAAGDLHWTYPARLQARLATALPGIELIVINKGVAHQTTAEMAARLDRDVLAEHPQLVIWEPGTVDAARSLDVDAFAETLGDGLVKLHEAGIDIIVMDMQYAPSTVSIIDFTPYVDTVHRVADLAAVPVFNRFEIMHNWAETGQFSFDQTAPDARMATARRVYDCLAAGLADGIAAALK
jgi:acyl-CoA thioesterase-1